MRRNTFDEVVVQVQRLKAVEMADGDIDFLKAVFGQIHFDDVAEIKVGGQLGRVSLDLLRSGGGGRGGGRRGRRLGMAERRGRDAIIFSNNF